MTFIKRVYTVFLFVILMPVLSVPALAQKSKKQKSSSEKSSFKPKVLSEQDRVHFEAYFIEGMKYYLLGDLKGANALFEKAYTIDPTSGGLNYEIAKINYFSGNNAKALTAIQAAVKSDNKNGENYIVLAKVYEAQSNYEEAVKTYKKMIAEVPGSEPYYYDLGANYIQLKNYDEAIKTYNKIEAYYGKSLELTRQKQQLYVKEGKIEQAAKEGQMLIDAYPNELEYKVAQAEFLYYNNHRPEAMQLLEGVLAKDPDNVKAHLLLADIYKFQNQRDKAFNEYKYLLSSPSVEATSKQEIVKEAIVNAKTDSSRAQLLELADIFVKSDSDNSLAIVCYADALFLNGKKKEAWTQYCKSLQYDSNNYNVWIQVLSLDYEFSNYDSLNVHSDKAVEAFPNQAALWYFRGMGAFNQKNYPKSIESLEETKKLAGTNNELKVTSLIMLADAYNETKQYAKSDAAYDEVLKYDKNNDHALNNYSYYLSLRKERLPDAKNMAERVVSRNPDEANYIDTYAWVLYQMKDYEGAKKQLDKAVKNSKNGAILEHYGDVLYQLGDHKSALEYWKKAKAAGDASDLINKKIADGKLYE
ncbi:MAG: tetratricopeptide repeat protein [Cytophagales bacterium]|nr:tetratricopeptide repeat protein [Cytophaga sp.]